MPIYEYQCKACDEKTEFIQRASEAPKTDCPSCGKKNTLQKLISSPAIQFKGSGWYLTDYSDKGKKHQAAAKKETSATTTESASSESSKTKDSSSKSSSATTTTD